MWNYMRWEMIIVIIGFSVTQCMLQACPGEFIPFEGNTEADLSATIPIVMLDPTKCLDKCSLVPDGWTMSFENSDCTDATSNFKMCLSNLYIYI